MNNNKTIKYLSMKNYTYEYYKIIVKRKTAGYKWVTVVMDGVKFELFDIISYKEQFIDKPGRTDTLIRVAGWPSCLRVCWLTHVGTLIFFLFPLNMKPEEREYPGTMIVSHFQ